MGGVAGLDGLPRVPGQARDGCLAWRSWLCGSAIMPSAVIWAGDCGRVTSWLLAGAPENGSVWAAAIRGVTGTRKRRIAVTLIPSRSRSTHLVRGRAAHTRGGPTLQHGQRRGSEDGDAAERSLPVSSGSRRASGFGPEGLATDRAPGNLTGARSHDRAGSWMPERRAADLVKPFRQGTCCRKRRM